MTSLLLLLLLSLTLSNFSGDASSWLQTEQWVTNVIGFSSWFGGNHPWSPNQVVGPPDVYPTCGDNGNAYCPQQQYSKDYLVLEYIDDVYINGVDVYETYGAGGVVKLSAYASSNTGGSWITVWQTPQPQLIKNCRIFSIPFTQLNFTSRQIRLDISGLATANWVEIDAVKLKGVKHLDSCYTLPCKNGGSCTVTGEITYSCQCALGFTGQNCSDDAIDLAKGQPTWQSSTTTDSLSSSYAVNSVPGKCQSTACLSTDVNPWWAVDLGRAFLVEGVTMTNVATSNAQNMNNFTVGLTNAPPYIVAPKLMNYTVCSQYPGAVTSSSTVSLHCSKSSNTKTAFRYLIIQVTSLCVNMCQLRVFGTAAENSQLWTVQDGQWLHETVYGVLASSGSMDCSLMCWTDRLCDSVNYCKSNNTCQLLSQTDRLTADRNQLFNDSDWQWWRPNYIALH